MIFTKDIPTKPGIFAWRNIGDARISIRRLHNHASASGGLVQIDPQWLFAHEIGGEWCLLVPSDEIEKAFVEGMNIPNWRSESPLYAQARNHWWEQSRAKRVAEGTES